MKKLLVFLSLFLLMIPTNLVSVLAEDDFEFDDVEDALEESTGASDIEELYELDDKITVYDENDIEYKINGYKLFELKDISRDWEIVFDDNRDRGGIFAVNVSITNNSDEAVRYGASQTYSIEGTNRTWSHTSQMIPEENQFNTQLHSVDGVIEPGEEIKGYEIVTLTEEGLDAALKSGEINYEPGYINLDPKSESSSDRVNSDNIIVLPISEEAEDKLSESGDLYPDKVIVDNLGKKTLLDEGTDVAKETLEDIEINIDGYQIAEFEPNSDEAPRYEGFKDGVILYTIKYTITNNSDKEENQVAFSSGYANLVFNESVQYRSEGMLEPDTVDYDTVLEKGDSATGYYVFPLSKDDYEMYEGKSVILDMTVMDKDYNAINDYQGLLFTIIEEE